MFLFFQVCFGDVFRGGLLRVGSIHSSPEDCRRRWEGGIITRRGRKRFISGRRRGSGRWFLLELATIFGFFFRNHLGVLTVVFCRPADKLSLNQSASLTATGFIWARYSMIIIPKNYVLFSVNVALGLTGLMQVMRVLHYQTTDEYQKLQVQN